MAMQEDLRAAIQLVEEWNARGWGEYLLWECLTGKREHPFPEWTHVEISDLMLGILCRLQTEHKVWPVWMKGRWLTMPIDKWENIAASRSANEARELSVRT